MAVEDLARQIEPAALCILVEIAQDVGELQGAAERMGDPVRRRAGIAEDMHREAADGAGDPVAIKVERREIGRADILLRVHLHAVDDVEEIALAQLEVLDRRDERAGDQVARPAGIDRLDLARASRRARLVRSAAGQSSAMSSTSRQKA